MAEGKGIMLEELTRTTSNALSELEQRLLSSSVPPSDGLRVLGGQLEQLVRGLQNQVEASRENSEALRSSTGARAAEGAARTAGAVAQQSASLLGGALGLSPLLGGLLKLFGLRSSEAGPPPAPVTFSLPAPIRADLGLVQGGTQVVESGWGEDGLNRAVRSSPGPAPSITVNVNALDARSILERSDDIAAAVRSAVLQSHSLNDVLNDL